MVAKLTTKFSGCMVVITNLGRIFIIILYTLCMHIMYYYVAINNIIRGPQEKDLVFCIFFIDAVEVFSLVAA